MLKRLLLYLLTLWAGHYAYAQYSVTGELKKWHKVTITFDGPPATENTNPNPFTDYRLDVTFTNGTRSHIVPGYFAADGNAAETSADAGSKWRVHFAPDAEGEWTFTAAFRTGPNVAVSPDPNAGSATSFNGTSGTFTIEPTDKSGRDHRAKGRLEYVGERYLRFAETEEYFLKVGADAPENLLAYDDFDNTPDKGGRRKTWAPHLRDWRQGDPTWQDGKGKGIIGAINYLASEGQNACSFLTMNIGGDDKNVFPYISDAPEDRLRMDCSKLDQWEILFEHADHLGLYLHFKTQETENDQLLDGGALGPERRLYYRELIARFSHHLALNWNIGEENTNTVEQRRTFAQFFRDHDPYQHHIVIHTYPGQHEQVYSQLVGDQSEYTGASLQVGWNGVHRRTLQWIEESQLTGRPWVVANDEQGNAQIGVPHDDYEGAPGQDDIRKAVLWGHLMAGGAGVEYYFGYSLPHSDLTCQDFRSRSKMWAYNRYAHTFFMNYIPFWEMNNHNELISNTNYSNDAYCFAKPGDTYLVYLADGGSTDLDFQNNSGPFAIKWFNPRNGEGPMNGSRTAITSAAGSGAWVEADGIVVIEMESADHLVGDWRTANHNLFSPNINNPDAASGGNFIVWEGSQSLGRTGNGMMTYPVKISTPGTYKFQWRNQVGKGTNTTEHNDTWLKIEADAFYGQKNNGNSTVCPKGASADNDCIGGSPNGSGEKGFFKVYSSGANNWSWSTRTSDNDAHEIYARFDQPGVYSIIVSARSNHHVIDRMVLAKTDYAGDPRSLDLPESPRETGSKGPLGVANIGSPPNEAGQDWIALISAASISCPTVGTPCNDGDPSTFNDQQDGNCNCTGESCPEAGTACNDGNPNTLNDAEDGFCNCQGIIPGEENIAWLEAECSEVGANWEIREDDQASNGQYASSPGGTRLDQPPTDEQDLVRFSFQVGEPGTYRVYVRSMVMDDNDNSFWVRVDENDWQRWNHVNAGSSNAMYNWDQVGNWMSGPVATPVTFDLDAGSHDLIFGHREPGVRLDKVFITRSPESPMGLGMPASNCTLTHTGEQLTTQEIRLFPNPAGEHLSIQWHNTRNSRQALQLRILNSMGQEVRSWEDPNGAAWNQPIDIRHLSPGWYTLQVITNSERFIGTFIRK